MKYFKCCKCENLYSFPSRQAMRLMQCGAFIGTKKIVPEGGLGPEEVPVGCGGRIIKISEEAANLIVDSMR